METLYTNKKFIKASIALVVLLSLFVLALFINALKASSYVGRDGQGVPTISVSGTADVTAVSDIATLTVNLSYDGKTTTEAQKLLNDSITKTLEYLKSKNIEDKDIKSEYGGLSPKYSYSNIVCITYPCPQKDPVISGYTATQSITIKVRAVDSASDIRTGLASLGITNISGPDFSIDDTDAFKDQAREKAIIDAQEKAKVLAKQLGVRLGKITSFSETSATPYPMYDAKMMSAAGASEVPQAAPTLPKGENKITSNVSITYEIK